MSFCDDTVAKRCISIAKYMILTGATVRRAASVFGISKSTVHKDVTERLKTCDKELFYRTEEVLMKNKSERHLRGGEATRVKYLLIRQSARERKGAVKTFYPKKKAEKKSV